MTQQLTAALMFPVLFLLIFLGLPVSFALIASAFVFGLSMFGSLVGHQLYGIILSTTSQYVLSAVPAFVLMGCLLERSGIAERLFRAIQLWVGRLPGGLALSTMAMAAVFAASTGIVGAVEVVIGIMAIPVMMSYRYSRSLIAGTICAGGSLGTMIPPTITVIIYATAANLSVGKLFAGILIPGVVMVILFLAYILVHSLIWPEDGAPSEKEGDRVPLGEKLIVTATALLPALALIVAVLGSILLGIASPTEAASVGSLGALLLVIANGQFNRPVIIDALRRTLMINSMILLIVVGGTMFAAVFRLHGGNQLVSGFIGGFDLSTNGLIWLVLLIAFVGGFVLDWVSILLICLPIFVPLLNAQGVDPIWFAVMMLIVIQTAYLTPPMAPSIFYLRSISPPEITYADMYRGVMPFIICQFIVLTLVFLFPSSALYLASKVGGEF